MDRRTLLRNAAAVPMWSALGAIAPALAAGGFQRVRPGRPGWPSAAEWEGLNRAVRGNLSVPVSPYGDCAKAGGQKGCAANIEMLRNPFYLAGDPGATQAYGWLDAWTTTPSAYAVAAETAADVAAAVNFAREHRLRLVVKGGGHSYQGTSCSPDSLMIWMLAMNEVKLHDAFVAEGCEGTVKPQPAASIGAGALWIDAYDAVTTKAGGYVQGGGCTTVGVAGHIQSGGFGSWSKAFGTSSGNLLEAEVVTADGKIRVVNPCKEPELFWALKGGGGGSWGVVTRATVRTHVLPENFGWAEGGIRAKSDEAYRRLIARFVDFYAEALFNPHWGEQAAVRPDNGLALKFVSQGLSADEAKAVWKPFLDWVKAAPGDYEIVEGVYVGAAPARIEWDVQARKNRGSTAMKSDDRPGAAAHNAWWGGDGEQASMLLHGYESVWLPASLLEPAQRPRLVEALFAASRRFEVGLHFNKGLAGGTADAIAGARNTAMNPAVLDAFALAITATGGYPPLPGLPVPPFDVSVARRNKLAIDAANAELLKVAPEAGSYVSESNYFNKQWAKAFWGPNYPRLQAVKRKYDPEGLFFVHHGVGSEEWSADGFERLG